MVDMEGVDVQQINVFCCFLATKASGDESYITRLMSRRYGKCATRKGGRFMPADRDIEKFPTVELQELREGLLQQGLDSWQAADLISSFLAGRGYGVSRQSARDAVLRGEGLSHSIDCMQAELEKLAMVM
jgi:hypothetical protein